MKMTALRKAARGQDCTLQIHPHCNGNPETVVFCHFPSEQKGMGIKSPDFWGADGCSSCHDVIDGRTKTDIPKSEILECMMRGLLRTLVRRMTQDLIKVKGVNE